MAVWSEARLTVWSLLWKSSFGSRKNVKTGRSRKGQVQDLFKGHEEGLVKFFLQQMNRLESTIWSSSGTCTHVPVAVGGTLECLDWGLRPTLTLSYFPVRIKRGPPPNKTIFLSTWCVFATQKCPCKRGVPKSQLKKKKKKSSPNLTFLKKFFSFTKSSANVSRNN